MRETTTKKLGSLSPFTEPHDNYTKQGATSVEKGGSTTPAGKHPGGNLGKFLHQKKGYTPNSGKPASELNSTVDANTGGSRVRPTQ